MAQNTPLCTFFFHPTPAPLRSARLRSAHSPVCFRFVASVDLHLPQIHPPGRCEFLFVRALAYRLDLQPPQVLGQFSQFFFAAPFSLISERGWWHHRSLARSHAKLKITHLHSFHRFPSSISLHSTIFLHSLFGMWLVASIPLTTSFRFSISLCFKISPSSSAKEVIFSGARLIRIVVL